MTDTNHIEQCARELLAAELKAAGRTKGSEAVLAGDLYADTRIALRAISHALSAGASGGGGATPTTVPREPAPPHALPEWHECQRVIENYEFHLRAIAGKEGPQLVTIDPDPREPTELERFIYEYDDADRYRSAWFMHRLEKLIEFIRSEAITTPASPATGEEKCPICSETEPYTGTCGSNDPRALCKRAAPQPAAAHWSAWLESQSDDDLEVIFAFRPDLAKRLRSMLAAHPQQAPAQEGGWKKMTDEARKLQMRHLDKHEGDVYHAMQWLVTKFGAKDSAPLIVPATPPAHGDGEVRIGATRCYGDDAWFRELTVQGVTFLAPLDDQDRARHILARPTPEADARDGVALKAGRAFNPGDRVEWQSSFGDWFPAKIVAVKDGITTYTAELDDGTTATDFAAGRFRKLAMSLPAQGEGENG